MMAGKNGVQPEKSHGSMQMELGVRSTVKLIVVNDGKVLLNRCNSNPIGEY